MASSPTVKKPRESRYSLSSFFIQRSHLSTYYLNCTPLLTPVAYHFTSLWYAIFYHCQVSTSETKQYLGHTALSRPFCPGRLTHGCHRRTLQSGAVGGTRRKTQGKVVERIPVRKRISSDSGCKKWTPTHEHTTHPKATLS
jgi:hypothetical protein